MTDFYSRLRDFSYLCPAVNSLKKRNVFSLNTFYVIQESFALVISFHTACLFLLASPDKDRFERLSFQLFVFADQPVAFLF